MDYIKSKFSSSSIYYGLFILFLPIFGSLAFITKISKKGIEDIGGMLLLLLFLTIIFISIVYIKHIKYIIIKNDKLKYYSFLNPFGKTLFFENYIGKIETNETGSNGSYKVVYLVDKQNRTAFKLMGLHYKKFGELNNAIPLRKIDFSPTTRQYFKLLFFERIKITETGSNPDNDRSVNKVLNAIQVFAAIGVGLFVLGMIVKMIAKLGG